MAFITLQATEEGRSFPTTFQAATNGIVIILSHELTDNLHLPVSVSTFSHLFPLQVLLDPSLIKTKTLERAAKQVSKAKVFFVQEILGMIFSILDVTFLQKTKFILSFPTYQFQRD